MPLVSVLSGAYAGTWNSSAIGCSEDGFRLRMQVNKLAVVGDCYGDTVIDAIYRGMNCFITVNSIAAITAQLMINPYGTDIGALGVVGKLDVGSSLAAALALSAVTGTPAAGASDLGTLTAAAAALDENLNSELNFNARVRTVPLSWRLFPTTISSVDRLFSFT